MIKKYTTNQNTLAEITARKSGESVDVTAQVSKIVEAVKIDKDQALKYYSRKFDQYECPNFAVTAEEIQESFTLVDQTLIEIMQTAWQRIYQFHEKQKSHGYIMTQDGQVMGQRVLPLDCVGVYVPGGTAVYPSTVLMDVAPAKVAGVEKIILITPPDKNGKVNPSILVASQIAGVDQIYKVGGAHGIAALAYGTPSIPKVDKIVGPGNIYVATAKRLVYGQVDIDMIAGPSDVLIIADDSANVKWLAADLLAQAEHDMLAQAILLTDSSRIFEQIENELTNQLALLPREAIARQSLINNGKVVLVQNIEEACQIANQIAPEHLELAVDQPFAYLGSIKHAGSIFLGHYTPEVLGDYLAGPNHTLPTEGTARFYSALSVDDFVKKSSYLYYSKNALATQIDSIAHFAKAEGLFGHAQSALIRKEKNQ